MQLISIHDYLNRADRAFLMDVRTPAEFEKGHVPGAVNFPLFTNEERAEVGTLYKQVGPEPAYLRGLELVGPKISHFVKAAFQLAPDRRVVVHCWRGGKRSASVGSLLQFSGFQVEVVTGGYKAFRQTVLEAFEKINARIIILGGKTGSGKTEILRHLAEMGEQVLDLEKLAHHKGSAFGGLGELPQPTVEQFENDLYFDWLQLDTSRRIWVENESRSIGKVFVPAGLWDLMRNSPIVQVELPFQHRVQRLVIDYAHFPKEQLELSLRKIEKRMGGQNMKASLEAFLAGDIAAATAIALEYYDKTYDHATAKGNFCKSYHFEPSDFDCGEIAAQLITFANDNGL